MHRLPRGIQTGVPSVSIGDGDDSRVFDLSVPRLVPTVRRRSRLAALLVCLSVVTLLSADWIAAVHGDDDPICDPVGSAAAAGASTTTVQSGDGAGAPHHCPICHWLRSLRSLAAHGVLVTLTIVPCGPLPAALLSGEIHVAALPVPARAPPVL